jgi:hypothetical protein
VDVPKGALNPIGGAGGQTVNNVIVVPNNPDQILVCSKTSMLYLLNIRGQMLKSFTHDKKSGADFISAAISPHGDFVYAVAEDSVMYAFNISNGALVSELKVRKKTSMRSKSLYESRVYLSLAAFSLLMQRSSALPPTHTPIYWLFMMRRVKLCYVKHKQDIILHMVFGNDAKMYSLSKMDVYRTIKHIRHKILISY